MCLELLEVFGNTSLYKMQLHCSSPLVLRLTSTELEVASGGQIWLDSQWPRSWGHEEL